MKHQTATRDDLEDAFQAAIDSADATEPEQGGKRRPFERPTRNFKELIGAQAQVYAAEMKRRKVRK